MIDFGTFLLSAAWLYAGSLLLALACLPFCRNYALARVAAPVAFVLAFQFIEHFIGLGSLFWLSPGLCAALIYIVYRRHGFAAVRHNLGTELAVLAGFTYCLLWRSAFPDIGPSSEKMADLAFICDYMRATKLPPLDGWLPPFRFDFYYSLQHYAAALAGRLLDLKAGAAFHLGYCLLAGLVAAAAYGIAAQFARARAHRLLAVAALFLGGTGAVVFVPFMCKNHAPLHASMRFMGSFARADMPDLNAFGLKIAALGKVVGPDLPVEIFSYLVYLGDYHAPLGGFLLLTLALLGMALVERDMKESRRPPALLYGLILATVPAALITNIWVAPLQAVLIASWIWYPLCQSKYRPDWRGPVCVLCVAVALIYPFLKNLAPHTLTSNSGLKLVLSADRPSLWHWLMVFWPALTLLLIAASLRSDRQISRRWALSWSLLLIWAELFYIKDIYSGQFSRFNTYLKWMPWIYNGILLTLGPLCLGQAPKLRRWLAAAVLVLVCVYAAALGRQFWETSKPFAGRMDGDTWLTQDAAQRAIIERLARLPQGVALEYPENTGFARSPGMAMAAGQPAFVGWIGHEQLWRGGRYDIQKRYDDAQSFYRGLGADSLQWLEANRIRYIIWLAGQNTDPTAFSRLSAILGTGYLWQETYRAGDFRVGFWEKAGP